MQRQIAFLIVASLVGVCVPMAPPALAQGSPSTTPDFSGVYYPVQQGRGGGRGQRAGGPPAGAPARPTQSAPVSDGSQGRSPDAPSLTPEYMAKWEVIRKSRMAGSVPVRQQRQVSAARNASDDEHGVRHGGHADEGQDHVLQRAERRAATSVPGRSQADAEAPGRPDVRRATRLVSGKGTRSSSRRSRCTPIRSSRASLPTATRWWSGSVFASSVRDCSRTSSR